MTTYKTLSIDFQTGNLTLGKTFEVKDDIDRIAYGGYVVTACDRDGVSLAYNINKYSKEEGLALLQRKVRTTIWEFSLDGVVLPNPDTFNWVYPEGE